MSNYLTFAHQVYSNRGVTGVWNEGSSFAVEVGLRKLNPILDREPEYVLDREWDVLIILDACRVDALEEVADEYDFLPEPPFDSIWSAESYSKGWLEENFTGKQALKHRKRMRRMTHISGNPFTEIFGGDEFGLLDEVWEYGWDDENKYMPPEPITQRAVEEYDADRDGQMLVHYMQPHAPFVDDGVTEYSLTLDKFDNTEEMLDDRTPWMQYRYGDLDKDELWSAYLDTLRVGLDSVEQLLAEVAEDETVIITADHANGMGEWGVYGHPASVPVPAVREVPWVEADVSAVDESVESEESEVKPDGGEKVARKEQLEHLGYL